MHNQRLSSTKNLPTFRIIANLLACLLFLFSMAAQATAPRINAEMFGDENKAEIVGYQFTPQDNKAKRDGELLAEIISTAFKAVGATPTFDMLPSKQLATYALTSNDAVGYVGTPQDLATNPKNKYRSIPLAFIGSEAFSLILSGSSRGDELFKAFNQGLQQIIKNGKYLELLEKYIGKDQIPTDYIARLKKLNPNWK